MIDPITGVAVAAKVAAGAADSVVKSGLLQRVLGPAADEIGLALARWSAYRMRNMGRIVESADRKSSGSHDDFQVHPRVAHRLLDDGSFCDDELMVEYLGGMLAGSRTPSGRDDRAVAWSELVTSLSAVQIKAHYLLYREWALRLRGRTDVNIGIDGGRRLAAMDVELIEFVTVLTKNADLDPSIALSHAIPGLVRVGLLDGEFQYGEDLTADSSYPNVLRVKPSIAGVELFGWAMGCPDIQAINLIAIELDEETDGSPLPDRLESAILPNLPQLPASDDCKP
jgi:hypothetical protein